MINQTLNVSAFTVPYYNNLICTFILKRYKLNGGLEIVKSCNGTEIPTPCKPFCNNIIIPNLNDTDNYQLTLHVPNITHKHYEFIDSSFYFF